MKSLSRNFQACSHTYQPNAFTPKRYQKKEKQRNCFQRSCKRRIEWLLQAKPALFRSLLLCSRITRLRRKYLLVLTVAEPSRASFSEGQSAGSPATSIWSYACKSIVNNKVSSFWLRFFFFHFKEEKMKR